MPGYYLFKGPEEEYYRKLVSRPSRPDAFSKYRGVAKNSGLKPYRAQFSFKGRRYYLGAFDDEISAAKAYNKVVLQVVGPHALLNEIPEEHLDHDSTTTASQPA